MTSNTDQNFGAIPQGNPALLATPGAVELLASTIPARVAYMALDGTPRVVPTWFQWTGTEMVMATFITAPHVVKPAARIAALRRHSTVCTTVDTDTFPPRALTLRGDVTVDEIEGIDVDYAAAARRYLGDEAATGYLAGIDSPTTRMARISLTPSWVGLIDFDTRLPQPLGGVTA